MNEADLAEIETKLGITLPKEYRQIMVERDADLWAARKRIDSIFLEPDQLIQANQGENQAGSGTEEAVPGWAKKYVLIGTDGAGGYYCLRLKRSRKVWMIGSDCDNEEEQAPNFAAFVQEQIGPLSPATTPHDLATDGASGAFPIGNAISITIEVKSLRSSVGHGKSEKGKTEESGEIKIESVDEKRSLTMDELKGARIDVAELARRAVRTIALAAKNDPNAYRIATAPRVKAGSVAVRFDPPPIMLGEAGSNKLLRLRVKPLPDGKPGGRLWLRIWDDAHKTKAPPPERVGIDWQAFQLAALAMIELLHGGKHTVLSGLRSVPPSDVDPRYYWYYMFEIAVT